MKSVSHRLMAMLFACLMFVSIFSVSCSAKTSEVPLDDDVVQAARELCKDYGIDAALLWAIIETESSFNVNAGNTNCKGLMGVHKSYAGFYAKRAGMSSYNLFNAIDNIHIGLEMLKEHINKYGDTADALIAYNNGDGGAQSYFRKGVHSTSYSRKVQTRREKWAAVEAAETAVEVTPIEETPIEETPVVKNPTEPVEEVVVVVPEEKPEETIIHVDSQLSNKVPEIHYIRLRDILL